MVVDKRQLLHGIYLQVGSLPPFIVLSLHQRYLPTGSAHKLCNLLIILRASFHIKEGAGIMRNGPQVVVIEPVCVCGLHQLNSSQTKSVCPAAEGPPPPHQTLTHTLTHPHPHTHTRTHLHTFALATVIPNPKLTLTLD